MGHSSAMVETRRVVHRAKRRFAWTRPLIYTILIVGGVLMIFPFVWLLRSSLMDNNQIFIFPPEWIPNPVKWSNYKDALTSVPFLRYFLNTMTIELFAVTGVLFTGVAAAYSFARLQWPGRDALFSVLLATMMLPYAVTLIPTFMLWKSLGALNTFIPLTVPAWFGAMPGTSVFQMFLLRQFFRGIPKDLDEAAYIDGAKPLMVLWRVVIPLSRPALAVVTIFTFIDVWNDFLAPIIYLRSDDKFTLALGLATFKGLYNAQWGYLMAASAAIVSPILVLFFFAQRYFIEGISLTGIKG